LVLKIPCEFCEIKLFSEDAAKVQTAKSIECVFMASLPISEANALGLFFENKLIHNYLNVSAILEYLAN
jgi:hypothetical protein